MDSPYTSLGCPARVIKDEHFGIELPAYITRHPTFRLARQKGGPEMQTYKSQRQTLGSENTNNRTVEESKRRGSKVSEEKLVNYHILE